MSSVANARNQRRRRIHERQALIFGALITGLLVVGVLAGGVYLGIIPAPFGNDISRPTAGGPGKNLPVVCPPAGALPVTLDKIKTRVFNGAGVQGLAAKTKAELESRTVVVAEIGNAPNFSQQAKLTFGVNGIAAAYTLSTQFSQTQLVLDGRQDDVVDVVLGVKFTQLKDPTEAVIDPAVPLKPVEGCVPAKDIKLPTPTTPATTSAPSG